MARREPEPNVPKPNMAGLLMLRTIAQILNNSGNRFPEFNGQQLIPNENRYNSRSFGNHSLSQPYVLLEYFERESDINEDEVDITHNPSAIASCGYPFFAVQIDHPARPQFNEGFGFWGQGKPRALNEHFIGGDGKVYSINNTWIISRDGRVFRLSTIGSLSRVYGYTAENAWEYNTDRYSPTNPPPPIMIWFSLNPSNMNGLLQTKLFLQRLKKRNICKGI